VVALPEIELEILSRKAPLKHAEWISRFSGNVKTRRDIDRFTHGVGHRLQHETGFSDSAKRYVDLSIPSEGNDRDGRRAYSWFITSRRHLRASTKLQRVGLF
jgi:hypothetical protein